MYRLRANAAILTSGVIVVPGIFWLVRSQETVVSVSSTKTINPCHSITNSIAANPIGRRTAP